MWRPRTLHLIICFADENLLHQHRANGFVIKSLPTFIHKARNFQFTTDFHEATLLPRLGTPPPQSFRQDHQFGIGFFEALPSLTLALFFSHPLPSVAKLFHKSVFSSSTIAPTICREELSGGRTWQRMPVWSWISKSMVDGLTGQCRLVSHSQSHRLTASRSVQPRNQTQEKYWLD